LAVVDSVGIHIVDVASKKEVVTIERKGITALLWSPRGTYVISCEKLKGNDKNLKIWNPTTGENVASFEWKNAAKDGPKSIKFDIEEKFCARQVGKKIIEIYDAQNLSEPKFSI